MGKTKVKNDDFDLAEYVEIGLKGIEDKMEVCNKMIASGAVPQETLEQLRCSIQKGLDDRSWGYRAYIAARSLGYENSGRFYELALSDFQSGMGRRCKDAVRRMESQWEEEKDSRGAIRNILDDLMGVRTTIRVLDVNRKDRELMVTFRYPLDGDVTYGAAHFTSSGKVRITEDRKIQSLDDVHRTRKTVWKEIGEYR